jgi:hypothetical protein
MGRVRYGLIMDIKSIIKGAQRECTYPFQKKKIVVKTFFNPNC